MDCEELLEALRQEAEKKIAVIIREAAEEETRIVNEALLKISRLREDSQRLCSSVSGKRTADILSEREKKARLLNIAGELTLSARLYRISQASLSNLRNRDHEGVFRNLAEELPPLDWKAVRVNPGDAGIAREHFPEAGVIPDDSISGGMEVMTADGKIRVINTFEKRLERVWGDVLPNIMKEIHETV
jgi:vacuolar-type H+-ATPase subunit E/Vma4